jgi:4-amino-4-deoxy-L-arabinose transferase-like glycosyltransferase
VVELNLQKRDLKQRSEKRSHSSEYPKNYQNNSLNIFDVVLTAICSLFFIFLFAGHYFKNFQELQTFNYLKYAIIPLFSFCIYRYYRTRSKVIFFILLFALTVTWFSGSGFAYHWDSVQHVFRAKYYLSHSYFSVGERHSFIYLIWGAFYRVFGESENLTHLINMSLGICGIFGIYAIARELYGDFAGFLALLVSFTFPVFFVVNKWAYLDMPFTSSVIITFFFLFKYLKTRQDRFFYSSLLFAFLAYGIKDPGLVLLPVIFLTLAIYGQLSKKTFIPIIIMGLMSIVYYFRVMYYSKIMAEFSIITPLKFGTDSVLIWAGFLTHEMAQYIYSGILFLSVFAFLKIKEGNKLLLSALLAVQVIFLTITEIFPTAFLFSYPLFPYGHYLPYFILLGLSILLVILALLLKQAEIKISKKETVLLIWLAAFTSFFIINGRVLEYGSKLTLDTIVLDFRYLMPAFPALIILFCAGISKVLELNSSEKTKFLVTFVVALTLIFNFITATNLTFYYANFSNTHTEGYEQLSRQNPELVYTHWPFYRGEEYDLGRLTWKENNIEIKDIYSPDLNAATDSSYFLFDTYFYPPDKLLNFEEKKLEANTFLLSPLFPSVIQKPVTSVYIEKLKPGSILLGQGFYNAEYWESKPIRWMGDSSSLYIYSDKDTNMTLYLEAQSFSHKRTLDMYVNGNSVSSTPLFPGSFDRIETAVALKKGVNYVYLAVPEGSDRPAAFSSQEKDSRALSLAFQEIKVNCPS